ncbi:MAG TPA: PAS domain S-box protein [Geothrix sp.]|nr:PAS domain S-box protein [Geothrix sp.]
MSDSPLAEARPREEPSFAALLDLFPHPIWRADRAGHWDRFNQGWAAFTGRSPDQELREGWIQGIHPEDRERVLQGFRKGFQAGVAFQQEFRLRHMDGSYHWIQNQVSPIRDPEGGCAGFLGSCYDLSVARMVEARALRLGQLYEALCRINRIAKFSPGTDLLFEATSRVVVEVGRFCLAWIGILDPVTRLVLPVALHGSLQGVCMEEALRLVTEARPSADPDVPGGRGLVGQACREAHFALSNDLQSDERTSSLLALAVARGVQASATFPLIVRGQVRGALAIYATETGAFDSEVVDLLERVAEDISLAIERLEQSRRWSEVEGRLRTSERLFSATLDTLSAAIAILDESGRILAVNAAWMDFRNGRNPLVHGLKPGEDYGSVCSGLVAEGGTHAEVSMGTIEVMAGSRETFVAEYPEGGADPTRWYAVTVNRFEDEGLKRIVLAHREITDRRLFEKRLRESENLFRLITEHAADLIGLTNKDGRRVYCSPSYTSLLGYTSEELVQHSPLEIIHEEDRDRMRRTIQAIIDGHCDSITMKVRLIRKDGSSARFESHMVAIRDGEKKGSSGGLLVISRDISEREAAEQARQRMEVELRHAQKLESIGQLAAGIAHEINTPIQYIGDNLRFIQEAAGELLGALDAVPPQDPGGAVPEAELRALRQRLAAADLDYLRSELPKATRQSLEGVARVSRIVGAMKEFSHPGSESKTLADLNRAIESTVTVSRNEWKYIADLVLELDPNLPAVPCHSGEINQVVLNLIVNAAHAIGDRVGNSGQKGRITVRTQVEADRVAIQVEDTGGGIPEAIRDRVFDPFFTTKGVGRGSGQGLAIAHSVVVDKHGGTIGFETEPGQGTLFTIHLPLAPDAPGAP